MRTADLTDQSIGLATMHGKERAFGPVLVDRFGIELVVPNGFDTDKLGTFTGEVARPGSIEETAIAKARLGADVTGLDLVLASEGAYGPHPTVPFIPAGLEVVVFLDARSGRVIREHLLDENPVYDHIKIGPDTDLDAFLSKIRFPHHAVIARSTESHDRIVKGIRDRAQLDEVLDRLTRKSENGAPFLQTDMRAHLNLRRMETLTRLAEKLADRLATECPACQAAGFGMTETRKGLPCEWCDLPTKLVVSEVWTCIACGHSEDWPRRDGLAQADPGECERCNP